MASAEGIVTVRGRKYMVKWQSDGYVPGFRAFTTKPYCLGSSVLSADKRVSSDKLEAACIAIFRAELLAWFDDQPRVSP
jgi:hypothetical protein